MASLESLSDLLNDELKDIYDAEKQLTKALEELPVEYREAIVLRELEGLSYKEIADVADVPIGTVMSRLARARKRLQQSLTGPMRKEVQLGL